MRKSSVKSCLSVSIFAVSAVIGFVPVSAVAADQAEQPAPLPGDIVVTARKSEESILKTPVAVSALTSEDIQARGIVSIQDIAAYTPGMKVVNNGAGRNDRSFQQLIIRGFTPPNAIAQTTSVFIDGVPVSSAIAVSNVTNPARVEVLKGPQSAYFGRQTFAGALNIVTKTPSKSWSGTVDAMLGTRRNHDVMAELSGPIVPDILGVRATVRHYAKDGSYKNYGVPGQTMGDQETTTGTLALEFTPSDRFTAKAFGMITWNDDGPSAQGLISANALPSAGLVAQSNCTLLGKPSFCGTAPKLINTPSANTLNDAFIKNFLANPRGRLIDPKDGVHGYGLRSRFYHLHLAADYEVTDSLTLSSLTGMNRERNSQLADLDNYYDVGQPNIFGTPNSRSYFDFPFLVEQKLKDWSQEFRASLSLDRFKGTLGVSYLDAQYQNGLGGGNGGLGIDTFSQKLGKTRSRTKGAFFGLSYKVTDALTLSFDGRYQIDHLYAYAPEGGVNVTFPIFAPVGFYPENTVIADKSFKNFLPRAIVQYDLTPSTMVYASFARGVNPGAFNTGFLTNDLIVQQRAAAAGLTVPVNPEKLDNYEIGIKGKLLENRVSYTLAVYRAIWKDQINTVSFDATNAGGANGTGTDGFMANINAGRVRMQGIEAEIFSNLTPELSLDVAGAINDSNIRSLAAPSVTAFTGISDFSGKQNPFSAKYSAAVGAQYTREIPGWNDASAFVRTDVSYKSGVYSNAANIVKTPDLTLVNLRAGIKKGGASVEAFVTNLFNTHAYTSVADASLIVNNFRYTTGSALVVGLPDLRTAGVRIRYSF